MQCPICKQYETESLIDLGLMPLSVLGLQADPDKSIEGKCHPISVYRCMLCGHVYNNSYDPEFEQPFEGGCTMYNKGGPWHEHMQQVAQILRNTISVGPIVEIGAGNGEFARFLHDLPYIAYEPTADANECSKHVETKKQYFSPEADMDLVAPDVILMRHVLEHLTDPVRFMRRLSTEAKRSGIKPKLVIEVPCVTQALKQGRVEDWVYEHPHHFSPDSLAEAARLSGWACTHMWVTYNKEVIVAEFDVYGMDMTSKQDRFVIMDHLHHIGDDLMAMHQQRYGNVVLWGGAGKGATLVNMLNKPFPVVDSDERKWGKYVPGTAYRIESPKILHRLRPGIVVVTTSWRVGDIAEEIVREGYPVGRVANFSQGKLVTYQG